MTVGTLSTGGWRGGRAAGLFTLGLGAALLVIPSGAMFLRMVALAMLASAAGEAAVAVASGRSRERAAAIVLALSGFAGGGILLSQLAAAPSQVVRAVIGAIFLRAFAALIASLAAQPSGKGWLLCRAAAEMVVGAVLLTSMLAFVVATPFASLSTIFFGGSASVSGSLLGALLVVSFIAAGVSQLLAARLPV